MLKLQRTYGCVARPGTPRSYTINAGATLLGIGHTTLRGLIDDGQIKALKIRGAQWRIARSELCRAARLISANRTVNLARVLNDIDRRGRLLAVTEDVALRKILNSFNPVYCATLYRLGQCSLVQPSWAILIDFETVGSLAAREVAGQIALAHDRPPLFGVAPLDITVPAGVWDAVLDRPLDRKSVIRSLTPAWMASRRPG